MLQVGTVVCARYEILKEIGRGGMSVVYQARDYTSGKLLAIKDIARNGEENNRVVVQSLSGEGRLLKRLSNPHLPKIYEIIEDTDSFMVVMDYIEGVSLDRVIAEAGAQPEEQIYRWGMQICEVFHYLHNQTPPIVYRDMKPANIMLKPDGNIMMIDFGTARTQKVGMAMQSDTVCIGTEGFAAPEQFGGYGQSDARTDIFCLGSTLYNLVTGHSPCEKPKGILPLENWNKDLAKSPLNYIIGKCTKNDPAERYQTAMELYTDLQLASIGALRVPGVKGRSALLRRSGWQKQTVKDGTGNGGTGALSGLLGKTKGRSGGLKTEETEKKRPISLIPQTQPPSDSGWSKIGAQTPLTPQVAEDSTVHSVPIEEKQQEVVWEPEEQTEVFSPWRKLLMISGVTAVSLLLIGIILLLSGVFLMAYLVFFLAIGGLALMVVGLIGVLKNDR